jgi:cyclopropane fatty-acyl-phospholipid synthase-like methyltransferase
VTGPPAREKWNRRYAEPDFAPFPGAAADWLVENGDLLPGGGRALDLACGDGRNSRYLAERGFSVEALDISDVAVDALRAAAAAGGLDVRPRAVDLEAWRPAADAYDAIVNMNYLQRDLFAPLAAALRPGGVLVLETFAQAHVTELGNRMDARFLLAPNELLRAFPTLEVCHYREGVRNRSGRPRGVAGIVARRPAPA